MVMIFNKLKSNMRSFLFRNKKKVPTKRMILRLIRSLHPKITKNGLIRLGGDGDGGYLVPNDLNNIEACFSPGVGQISKFELECAQMGMKVFMADGSVNQPPLENEGMNFIKKFIGNKNDDNFITLENWIKSTKVNLESDLILQMDIEGHEFDVINSTSTELLKKFRIIIIEFHVLQSVWNKSYFYKAESTFQKLLKTHECVHIHPNNCCGIETIEGVDIPVVAEFTFYRKDKIKSRKKVKVFPHILDQDNTKNAHIVLPKTWYS